MSLGYVLFYFLSHPFRFRIKDKLEVKHVPRTIIYKIVCLEFRHMCWSFFFVAVNWHRGGVSSDSILKSHQQCLWCIYCVLTLFLCLQIYFKAKWFKTDFGLVSNIDTDVEKMDSCVSKLNLSIMNNHILLLYIQLKKLLLTTTDDSSCLSTHITSQMLSTKPKTSAICQDFQWSNCTLNQMSAGLAKIHASIRKVTKTKETVLP